MMQPRKLIWIGVVALLVSCQTPPEQGRPSVLERPRLVESSFDFLEGRWKVSHRRLNGRLQGSTEWTEFETDYEYHSLLGGLANMDRLWGELGGRSFEGVSVRTLDPESGEWTIYWMDTRHPQLAEQVRGRFEGDAGEFFGGQEFGGRQVVVRFIWRRLSDDHARWEQAYQDPDGGVWETNWIMEFRRLRPGAD